MAKGWELIHQDADGRLYRFALGAARGWLYRFDPARGSPSIAYEPC